MRLKDPRSLDERMRMALARRRNFTTEAIRLVFDVREKLVLSIGWAIAQIRESGDPLRMAFSRIKELELLLEESREENLYLRSRLERIRPRERSHYTPEERYKILVFMKTHLLSIQETAKRFLVTAETIARWLKEAIKDPDRTTIGSLLKAVPPLQSYGAVFRNLVHMMDQMGFGGADQIVRTLMRAGIKLGVETVRRWRKSPPSPAPQPGEGPAAPKASSPNHVWYVDMTEIKGFLGLVRYKLLVVLDGFSRLPLAHGIFSKEPKAREALGVLRRALRRYGRPKYLVSDEGPQFTAEVFVEALERLGIRPCRGGIGTVARIERFWKTLKGLLGLPYWRPLVEKALSRRVETSLAYYASFRPHSSLDGATPREVYFGLPPAHLHAVSPPRRSQVDNLTLEGAYFDPEARRLPVLIKKAA